MKKILAVILAMLMLFACTACGSSKSEAKDRLAQIKEKGYLELATEPYFAPFEFIDTAKSGDDQYQGCDIFLAQKIAEKIGVELKIVPLEFSAVLTGIADGKYDLAISALAYSPTRAETMNLSTPYLTELNDGQSQYGILVRNEDIGKYPTVESLKDAVLATQSGSVQEGIVKDMIPAYKDLKLFSAMTDAYLAVAEGKADVCICSIESANLYAEANGGISTDEQRFVLADDVEGTVAAATKEGTDSLMEVVNEVIKELTASGELLDQYYIAVEYAESLGIG